MIRWRRTARQRFQFDRSLSFVGDFVPHTKQRRNRIEQPAATGSLNRVDAAIDHSSRECELVLRQTSADTAIVELRPNSASKNAAAIRAGWRIAASPPASGRYCEMRNPAEAR